MKGGGIQNPVARRWVAFTGPRKEGRSTGKRIVPNRGPDLHESQVKLGGHILPARILTPDVEGIELYSLPMSNRETDSLPQGPFVSTLTVGILPS